MRFRSVDSGASGEESGKSRGVSMGARLKNVWSRKINEEGKSEEKVSKFSKLINKTKRESEEGNETVGNGTESSPYSYLC